MPNIGTLLAQWVAETFRAGMEDEMSEPTTAELIAWCERLLGDTEAARRSSLCTDTAALAFAEDAIMLRAIAARLRQATGKAEPAPTFDAKSWREEDGR